MGAFRKLAVMGTALVLGAGVSAAPVEAQPDGDLAAQLDSAIEARIAAMGVPGAIVTLDIPGQISYDRAFGVADVATGVATTAADHTRIGSVTKTFTGTALLQLVDQGRVRLTDPISQYVDGVPSGDVITLDMLGRMRSGLPDYSETDTFLNRVYSELPSGPDAFATTPRELIDAAFRRPVEFTPGTDYKYSNTNTVLLGMVVEKVTGLALGSYFEQNIFGPLGLAAHQLSAERSDARPLRSRLHQGARWHRARCLALEPVLG